jgi:WD40 repeat protein
MTFTSDDTTAAVGMFDGSVRVFDLRHHVELAPRLTHETAVGAMAFSADGGLLAVGTVAGSIRLWRTDSWQPWGTIPAHAARVRAIEFEPYGEMIASADHDGSFAVHRISSGFEIARYDDLASPAWMLVYADDGQRVTLLTDNGGISVHDAATAAAIPAESAIGRWGR